MTLAIRSDHRYRTVTALRVLAACVGLVVFLFALSAPANDFGKTGQGGKPVVEPPGAACNQCPCPAATSPGTPPPAKGAGAGPCAQNNAGIGSNANGGNGNAAAADPVEAFTGRFRYEHVDLELNGVLPIRMVRRYDSQSRYDSPLGYGWSFDYDVRLYEYEDGSVIVRGAFGQRERYVLTGNEYAHQDGARGRAGALTTVENGYELRYPSGDVAEFDAEGILTRLRDPQGNYLAFSYEGTPPARQDLMGISPFSPNPNQWGLVARVYQLTRIEEFLKGGSPTGRFVTLVYEPGKGRLDFIDSFDGRHVDYDFGEPTASPTFRGNLTKVTDAELIEYVYKYEDAADLHNLTFVQEGQGTTETRNVYDAQDRVATQTTGAAATARKWTFGYGPLTAAGRTTTVTRTIFDENGVEKPSAVSVLEFNASGHVTRKTDALGNRISYARTNAAGNQSLEPPEKIEITVERKTGPSSFATERVVTLTLDNHNITTRVVEIDGVDVIETWEYDTFDWITSYKQEIDGQSDFFLTTYAYIRGGIAPGQGGYSESAPPENIYSITRRIDASTSEVTTFTYDPASGQIAEIHLPAVTGSPSLEVVRTYHTAAPHKGLLASAGLRVGGGPELDPHLERTFTYDSRANLDVVTDANGNPTDFDFDKLGRLVAVTQQFRDESTIPIPTVNTTTVFTYTRPNDHLTSSELENPANWLPGRLLTRVEVGKTPLAEGHIRRLIHDPKGRLVRVERKNPNGPAFPVFASFKYNSDDLRVTATDGEGKETRFAYDGMTQLVSVIDPANNSTTFAYDVLGDRTLVHDAKNRDTVFVYDGLSRLVEVQVQGPNPDEVTRFLYDAAGNVRSVKDPKNQETLYTFDGLSRLRTVTQPNATDTVVYDYDARSRLVKVTNARGDELAYDYAPWGGLESVLHDADQDGVADSGERLISYTHDLSGNVLTTSDSQLESELGFSGPLYTFTYDPQNRVDDVTVHYLPGTDPVLDSRYDAFGNRTGLAAADATGSFAHTWRFDAFDRLDEAVLPGGANPTLELAYNGRDDVTGITRKNATPAAYLETINDYFDQGPVDTITVTDLLPSSTQRLLLDYGMPDATLNVTSQSESRDGAAGQTTSYLYEGADRLSDANYPVAFDLPADEAFDYDLAGNRDDNPAQPSPWSYDVSNRILSSPTPGGGADTTYEFDDDGNLETKTSPTGVESFTWDATNRLESFTKTGTTAAYAYDPFGRRIKKTVNSAETFYLWDGDQLLAEYDVSGVRQVRYAYAGGFAPIQVAKKNGGTENVYDVHSDELDTPRMLTDSTGVAVWRASYEAFGKAYDDKDPDGDLNEIAFNIRFPGQYFDAESGLHQNRHRTYDPATGRYISADPIGQSSGPNTYLYPSNPLVGIDPFGLRPIAQGGTLDTVNFVGNYLVGTPVDLGSVGLGDAFETSSSVRGQIADFDALLAQQAADAAQQACDGCPKGGTQSTTFSLASPGATNVTNEPGLYSVGRSTFARSGTCTVTVNCDTGAYSYSCSTSFGVNDAFTDPFRFRETFGGGGWNPPGTSPYPITHSFSRGTRGAGSLK